MAPTRSRTGGLRNDFRRIFAKAKMPTSPAMAARILKLIKDPNSGSSDFAEVIRTDPALTTKMFKTVNSVYFAQRTAVTTIERAVTILGLHRVKTISLGFELISHLDRLGGAPFDMKKFWQDSLIRACMARTIAHRIVPEREEEAFLIALLQETGVLMLVQVQGASYATLYRSSLSPSAFFSVERDSFPHTHVDAIAALANEWRLPEVIAVPLSRHHEPRKLPEEPTELDHLSTVSYFVGSLCLTSDLACNVEDQELRAYGKDVLGLTEELWIEIQEQSADEYKQICTMFGDILPDDVDVAELLGEANRQLASAASDADRRRFNLEAEKEVVKHEQQRLAKALKEYRERASLDPLTNLLNRGALTDATRKAIKRNLDHGEPIGAIFIDIDNFKNLNDTHGHEVGDNVLRALSALFVREAGALGTVGRYGGEEFVVILPNASQDTVKDTANALVVAVRACSTDQLGSPDRVTCSVGAVWSEGLTSDSAEELFAAADKLMYHAKRSGKDRCCVAAIGKAARSEGDVKGNVSRSETTPPADDDQPRKTDPVKALFDKLSSVAMALNSAEVDSFEGVRKQTRKKLVSACELHYYTGHREDTRTELTVSRNISTGGIALLIARPMARGEAVEVVLNKGGSKAYLAGLVSFCRRVEGKIHEIGVQFVTHAVEPIISGDACAAVKNLDWISQAVISKREGRLSYQMRD